MPTYQYRCTECGHDLEAVQKFTESALTECPSCGGVLRKVYNAVGVVFKGSGFYRTDSRKAPSEGGTAGSSTSAPAKESAGVTSGSGSGPSSTSGAGSNGNGSSSKPTPAKDTSGSSTSTSSTTAKAARS